MEESSIIIYGAVKTLLNRKALKNKRYQVTSELGDVKKQLNDATCSQPMKIQHFSVFFYAGIYKREIHMCWNL